ncbi:class I SAM-dependent methyltransferase [Chloroflexota bacterium]
MGYNKKTAKFWDRLAKNFAEEAQNIQLADNKDFVATLKYLKSADVVLDYGCAAGTVANAIADKVHEIQALDISPKMIEAAKKAAGARHIENIHYAQTTIFDERYQKESFNVILAFNILHLLEDAPHDIQRISDLLLPGGLFISTTPCLGQSMIFWRILLPLAVKMRITPYIGFFKAAELEALLTKENFQIVESESLSANPPDQFIVARKL